MTEPTYYTGPITADLSATDWPTHLAELMRVTQAHYDGGPIQPVRDLWRRSDPPYRAVINDAMGVQRG